VHELAKSCRAAAITSSDLLIGVSQALDRVRELQATFHVLHLDRRTGKGTWVKRCCDTATGAIA
jgi:hypothetical protein